MSAAAGRMAGKVGQVGQAAGKMASKANEAGSGKRKDSALQKGAKRDPELYVRMDHPVLGEHLLKLVIDPPHDHDGCFWHGWLSFRTQTNFLFIRSPSQHGRRNYALANHFKRRRRRRAFQIPVSSGWG